MYDHQSIDKKWQDRWEEAGVFYAQNDSSKPKFFCLIEFPYPSGAGLHIGHPRSYTALDVLARKRRMQGYNVLYPIGWDAFGLPTENYAIKTGRPPQEVTAENIATFKRQLQALGISFDWSREINTTDPAYYKWTQWQFLQFFKAGLAYKKKQPINWCVDCKIGLANEEVVDKACERCGGKVEKRDKEQWMIAITKYADRLLADLDTVDYLPKIKKQQQDWIGKSVGAEVDFVIASEAKQSNQDKIRVFTTRPDTLFGATYMVLAPEHPLVARMTTDEQRTAVDAYVSEAARASDIDRQDAGKEKTGVFTGAYVMNPVNGEKIPIWVADYVLMGYGTGAIMAVPAHDERDYAFATAFQLPIVEVVSGEGELPRVADGVLINSGTFTGLPTGEAKEKITAWLEEQGIGKRAVNFKLRDWVFSRQRYWGEPIPLVHCKSCSPETGGWVAVPDGQLPVELPKVEKYEPTETGESPLAAIEEWVNTACPSCGGPATRETDTMPNWAGSSWYFLRYTDPKNDQAFASKDALKYWMPVDWYNGGMEHTTLHLLYSRFWNKFLFDQGLVPVSEPYAKRTSHGLVLAADGTKMSKSKGNVVNPDEVVAKYGADTLRMYELFLGPFSEAVPWSEDGVLGVRRFLDKVMRLPESVVAQESEAVTRAFHQTIKKVSSDIESQRYNTAVSQLMTFVNVVNAQGGLQEETLVGFVQLLCPFAPHVANELFVQLPGQEPFVESLAWPEHDDALAAESELEIAVQVNGKLRGTITVPADANEEEVVKLAREQENVVKYLTAEPKKTIYVPGKLVSFVV